MLFESIKNVGHCRVHLRPKKIFGICWNGGKWYNRMRYVFFVLSVFLGVCFFDAQQFLDQRNRQLLHLGPSKGVGKGASSQGVAIVNLIISLLFFLKRSLLADKNQVEELKIWDIFGQVFFVCKGLC